MTSLFFMLPRLVWLNVIIGLLDLVDNMCNNGRPGGQRSCSGALKHTRPMAPKAFWLRLEGITVVNVDPLHLKARLT